jgi:serine/threonine-protein phosphatase 6 regulatory ankyrin repeat subunit B
MYFWQLQNSKSKLQDIIIMAKINEKLKLCATADNVREMKKLLRQGADMNYRSNGETVLMAAIRCESLKAVKYLLNKGAYCESALSIAATKSFHIMNVLLKRGVNADSLDASGRFPLYIASDCGNDEIVELLLKRRAQVNLQVQHSGESSLMAAARLQGGHGIINLLLKHGAEINLQDKRGFSALIHASQDNVRMGVIVQLLLKFGASVNLQDKEGLSALMHATSSEIASVLLEHGANMDLLDNNGDSALIHSVRNGHCGLQENY